MTVIGPKREREVTNGGGVRGGTSYFVLIATPHGMVLKHRDNFTFTLPLNIHVMVFRVMISCSDVVGILPHTEDHDIVSSLLRKSQKSFFAKHYWDDQIREDGMGGACSTHGTGDRFIPNVTRGDNLEDLSVDRKILKFWSVRVWTGFNWLRIGNISGLS
jgi:hypothetical protein